VTTQLQLIIIIIIIILYITWNVRSVYSVGRASNPNGGTLYTKESPATNNSQQRNDGKTTEKTGRWNNRECHCITCRKGWENKAKDTESWRQHTQKATAPIWAAIPS